MGRKTLSSPALWLDFRDQPNDLHFFISGAPQSAGADQTACIITRFFKNHFSASLGLYSFISFRAGGLFPIWGFVLILCVLRGFA